MFRPRARRRRARARRKAAARPARLFRMGDPHHDGSLPPLAERRARRTRHSEMVMGRTRGPNMNRLLTAILFLCLGAVASAATDAARPKVRSITAFVRLDRASYEKQIDEAMKVLDAAKAEFAKRGYETQTVRIVTQPFAELVKGLDDGQALAFLRALDDLSQKDGFMPNVGPAMLHDSDDPAAMKLLAQV